MSAISKIFALAIAVLLVSALLLVSFPDFLALPLLSGSDFPVGTLVAWVGILSLPLAALIATRLFAVTSPKFMIGLRALLSLCLLAALFWGPVGYWLSASWSLNFSGSSSSFRGSTEAGSLFWTYTGILILVPVLLLFTLVLCTLIRKLLRRSSS